MNIIAQRVLKIVTTKTTEVTISIERPFPDAQDFKCRYKIEWPEGTQQDINFSGLAKNKQLVWLEPEGGFGLPLPPNLTEKEVG
jgi:hypothetical protein